MSSCPQDDEAGRLSTNTLDPLALIEGVVSRTAEGGLIYCCMWCRSSLAPQAAKAYPGTGAVLHDRPRASGEQVVLSPRR